jgi:phosphoglycerol transferase
MTALVRVEPGRRRDIAVGIFTALAALVIACVGLKVWRGDLDVPFEYAEETQYYLMLAKGMDDHGGYFDNPSLGAPFGQELYDYAVGTDRLNLDLLRLLDLVFGSAAAAVNVFFLLSFPLAAAAAFLVFRLLGIARAPAVISALLFALLPYHFERGEGNLFLTAYWVVPLGAYLVLATLGGEQLFRRREGATGLRAYASRSTLLTVLFCAAVASTGVYYAAFTALLLAGAILVALVARLGRAVVLGGIGALALLVGVVLIHLSPSIAYQSANGRNELSERHWRESELYALKLSDLVFPIDLHRLEPLARFTADYKAATMIKSEPMAIGPVAAAGFIALLIAALVALAGRGAIARLGVLGHAAAANLLAVLIGTLGGLSTVIAILVTPQLRAWNRISIFIAFFSLVAVAIGLAALGRRLGTNPLRQLLFAGVLGLVLVFGLYNQITYVHVPPYDLKASYEQDRAFVQEIERRLPENAAVFQLPYLGFPETGRRFELFENDMLRGYLHSNDLRWSFGATKGRPEDWADDLVGMPTATVVDAATAAGFAGLYVDRFGYPDRAAALEREIRSRVGSEPLVNQSGRHSFFDLRAYRQRLEAAQPPARVAAFRRAVLEPFEYERNGFIRLEPSGGKRFAWARRATPELRIVNDTDVSRTAVFEATLDRVGAPAPAAVVVTFPGAAPVTYRTPAPIRRELSLPPGETVIRFSTDAPEVPALRENKLRPHYFRLANLDVTDTAFRPFVPR